MSVSALLNTPRHVQPSKMSVSVGVLQKHSHHTILAKENIMLSVYSPQTQDCT